MGYWASRLLQWTKVYIILRLILLTSLFVGALHMKWFLGKNSLEELNPSLSLQLVWIEYLFVWFFFAFF